MGAHVPTAVEVPIEAGHLPANPSSGGPIPHKKGHADWGASRILLQYGNAKWHPLRPLQTGSSDIKALWDGSVGWQVA